MNTKILMGDGKIVSTHDNCGALEIQGVLPADGVQGRGERLLKRKRTRVLASRIAR
jgi:hypothetical protein